MVDQLDIHEGKNEPWPKDGLYQYQYPGYDCTSVLTDGKLGKEFLLFSPQDWRWNLGSHAC
jgi:hypothetical protein